jgi:hypothetical protein
MLTGSAAWSALAWDAVLRRAAASASLTVGATAEVALAMVGRRGGAGPGARSAVQSPLV